MPQTRACMFIFLVTGERLIVVVTQLSLSVYHTETLSLHSLTPGVATPLPARDRNVNAYAISKNFHQHGDSFVVFFSRSVPSYRSPTTFATRFEVRTGGWVGMNLTYSEMKHPRRSVSVPDSLADCR